MELKFKHFVFLNSLDVLTTWYALTYMQLNEANTFLNSMFQNYGIINALILAKAIGLMLIYGVYFIQPLKIKKISINIICFIYMLVLLNNSYQMIRVMA